MSAPFSRIPEYLRKIFSYGLTPVEFSSCLNLIGRAKGLYFIQNLLRILFASSCFGEFHFLNFSKNIYGLGRMFHQIIVLVFFFAPPSFQEVLESRHELLSRHKKWYLMVPGLNTNYIWKSRKLAISFSWAGSKISKYLN